MEMEFHKQYFRRRGVTNFMLDAVLLMENTHDLRTAVVHGSRDVFYHLKCPLISVSIILQVFIGVLVVIQTSLENTHINKTRRNSQGEVLALTEIPQSDTETKSDDKHQKHNVRRIFLINTVVTIFTFLLFVVNIILRSLGEDYPSSDPGKPNKTNSSDLKQNNGHGNIFLWSEGGALVSNFNYTGTPASLNGTSINATEDSSFFNI